MDYTKEALMVFAARECGVIKTNAKFWANYADIEKFEKEVCNDETVKEASDNLKRKIESWDKVDGFICAYDNKFPVINKNVKNNGDKPYLLFYRGNISLLNNLNSNVAVIGLTDPDERIIERECGVVSRLVKNNLTIVSGLANGCDTVAHKTCLETDGKTIAILPSQVDKVIPAENRELAEMIVEKGGLLVSEYYDEAKSRYEAIDRLIKRDRLQAMFAKAIILIASYREGEGDSGSRHAMEAAMKYRISRYAMYNSKMDEGDKRFGLNKDFVSSVDINKVNILMSKSIEHIKSLEDSNLIRDKDSNDCEQLTIL